MSEINTSLRPEKPVNREKTSMKNVTRAVSAGLPGFGSGIPVDKTVDAIVAVERNRMVPIENRKKESQVEFEAFNRVKSGLESMKSTATPMVGSKIWEANLIESSQPEVMEAIGIGGAKPGKHTLMVERLALNHQLVSQGFEKLESEIGTGKFIFKIGAEGSDITTTLDKSNSTLEGLKEAINNSTKEVNATIIKTANKEVPYQMVLTSQKTGSDGQIFIKNKLKGGEAPNFSNGVDEPTDWTGLPAVDPPPEVEKPLDEAGASSAVVRISGYYTGEEDLTFTFTAVQSGKVSGENPLQLRWEDSEGRKGVVDLDKFHYDVPESIHVVDGFNLEISDGNIIVGDEFSVRATAEKSDNDWWLDPEERLATVTQPTLWKRQTQDAGAPEIGGNYSGEDEREYTLTVVGNGQIGSAEGLQIEWVSSAGDTGLLPVGKGYPVGNMLALPDGLTVTMKEGSLSEGQTSTFNVVPSEEKGWWIPEERRFIPSKITDGTNFKGTEEQQDPELQRPFPIFPEPEGPKKSDSLVQVIGEYDGQLQKTYTFTALKDGTVGTTKNLKIQWEDQYGNVGTLDIGEGYIPGGEQAFDNGLKLVLAAGRVFKGDSFTVKAHTATIQPAQDAIIKLGATAGGGGLEISSSTNELDEVIEGVKLVLKDISEKPVTITITGDTELAVSSVMDFTDRYNELIALMNELIKFDTETGIAGPLLGDRDINMLRGDLMNLMIDVVPGLPTDTNMLAALGIKLNDKGLMLVEEEVLRRKVAENFGKVADVFRNKGESSHPQVTFVSMTEDTAFAPDGYKVEISQAATQGYYLTSELPDKIEITPTNNVFTAKIYGKESKEFILDTGSYTISEYARILYNKLNDDDNVGIFKPRVMVEGNKIRIQSSRFGAGSSISFSTLDIKRPPGVGLNDGDSVSGMNVQGKIGNKEAEGTGKLLKSAENAGPTKGLRLIVSLSQDQIQDDKPEAIITLSKGISGTIEKYLKDMLDPKTGNIKRILENLRERIDAVNSQLVKMEERLESKRKRIKDRFIRMGVKMSTLKNQQNFLTTQLAGLPSMGGGKRKK